MTYTKLIRYLHTIRHIKPLQLACFVQQRVFPVTTISPYTGKITTCQNVGMSPIITHTNKAESQNEFVFLSNAKTFDLDRIDWPCREMSKLWRYNLHYFDYVHDVGRSPETISKLITSWIEHNPPNAEDAWEPFTVSLRIVNWIKLFLQPSSLNAVQKEWLQSLYHQALWLEQNIEKHLLANHFFKNGKALVFVGLYFSGADAERWLKKGQRIIRQELDEQILPDGGHFERSPMYHTMILQDCLDLLNLELGSGSEGLTEKLTEKCRIMLHFLGGMIHPNGEIALFNDAALGIEQTYAELADYFLRLTGEKAVTPDAPCWSFPDTGYFVMAPLPGDRLIIDCGPVGPDYQPGHAHCDTLSFELSLKGSRVIVDSGCCQYVDGDIRCYNRGNSGHNTLTIDGENQSEVWGTHRCARRARPVYGRLEKREDGMLIFSGAHDGYRRLKGKPIHHRTITWSGDAYQIEDRVEGEGLHDVESRLHIHPVLSVELADGSAVIRVGTELLATISTLGGVPIETTDGWYCPEFGLQQQCTVITTRSSMTRLPFSGGWVVKADR